MRPGISFALTRGKVAADISVSHGFAIMRLVGRFRALPKIKIQYVVADISHCITNTEQISE